MRSRNSTCMTLLGEELVDGTFLGSYGTGKSDLPGDPTDEGGDPINLS